MDDDGAGLFFSCVSEKFYEIKNRFKTKILHLGFIFDEDIFFRYLVEMQRHTFKALFRQE